MIAHGPALHTYEFRSSSTPSESFRILSSLPYLRHNPSMTRPALFLLLLGAILRPATAQQMQLPRVDYRDRVEAVWTAQIVAVLLAWPHEHQVASALGL